MKSEMMHAIAAGHGDILTGRFYLVTMQRHLSLHKERFTFERDGH